MVNQIILSNGAIALVDSLDYPIINRWKWKPHKGGYALRSTYVKGKFSGILMHRQIMGSPPGMEVHHKNENKLDNRRENLILMEPTVHRLEHIQTLIDYQKAHQIHPDIKNCVECGALFNVNPRKRKRHKCCSKTCAQTIRSRAGVLARQSSRRSRTCL